MDISVSQLYTVKLRLEEKFQMCYWQLTVHTINQTIFRVSAGAEMPVTLLLLKLAVIFRWKAVSREENTLNGSAKQKRKAALHMRFQ